MSQFKFANSQWLVSKVTRKVAPLIIGARLPDKRVGARSGEGETFDVWFFEVFSSNLLIEPTLNIAFVCFDKKFRARQESELALSKATTQTFLSSRFECELKSRLWHKWAMWREGYRQPILWHVHNSRRTRTPLLLFSYHKQFLFPLLNKSFLLVTYLLIVNMV